MPPHEAPSRAAQDAEWSAFGRCGGVVELRAGELGWRVSESEGEKTAAIPR